MQQQEEPAFEQQQREQAFEAQPLEQQERAIEAHAVDAVEEQEPQAAEGGVGHQEATHDTLGTSMRATAPAFATPTTPRRATKLSKFGR